MKQIQLYLRVILDVSEKINNTRTLSPNKTIWAVTNDGHSLIENIFLSSDLRPKRKG